MRSAAAKLGKHGVAMPPTTNLFGVAVETFEAMIERTGDLKG